MSPLAGAGGPAPDHDGPDVLVIVGTDHHPFDRLVAWADAWAKAHPDRLVVVQRGASSPPTAARYVDYLEHDQLERLICDVAVVVTHGGPSSIAESRRLGTMPIVVPRDPAYREHVDTHQLQFVQRMAACGLVLRAGSEDELAELVDQALATPSMTAVDTSGGDIAGAAAADLFGAAVAQLVTDDGKSRLQLQLRRRSDVEPELEPRRVH